jgi:glucuronate isomerase
MLYPKSPLFTRLLDAIAKMPVIDCHEHMRGPEGRPLYKEPIASLLNEYYMADIMAASFGVPDRDLQRLTDQEISTDEKWPTFEKLWSATKHTAYARITQLVLKNVYGEVEMSRPALEGRECLFSHH